jgi:hypothetical protein
MAQENLAPPGSVEYTTWLIQQRRREHKDAIAPDAPVGLSAILDVSQIDLSWPIQQGMVVNLYRSLSDVFSSSSIIQSFIDDSITYADLDIPPTAYWYWLTVSNGAGESDPSDSASSRLIPTFDGLNYCTFDQPITFTGDLEIEITFVSTNKDAALQNYFLDYGMLGSTRGWLYETEFNTLNWNIDCYSLVMLDGVVVDRLITNFPLDRKIHKLKIIGNSIVNIDFIGSRFNATRMFYGQILEVKFTDKSGATDVVTDYVFDSGSTTIQKPRGGVNHDCTLVNFSTSSWSRYTLQRNIAYDLGMITEAWVGENIVNNGGFNTDTDWIKGTGWSISGGTANGDGVNVQILSQSLSIDARASYFVTNTISGRTVGQLRAKLGGTNGVTRLINGTFKEIITTTDAISPLELNGLSTAFNGSIDNVAVQHFLEVIE